MNAKTEVRVADLTGQALDWAVAKAIGRPVFVHTVAEQMAELQPGDFTDYEKQRLWQIKKPRLRIAESPSYSNPCPAYSSDWSQGGSLIDKHRISFGTIGTGPEDEHGNEPIVALTSALHYKACEGTTHLIAACRAIVATAFGDTISIPAELA
ncbi:phage protein NinX family protein [Pseudomonas sp. MF6747]|uniref:phage protein NinX family protein n=1 Tax=Pseudomonas sp. MF6747 TaxID=2797527 RepID=UPI00190D9570|nr:phage protein NinX family protein [Pseudomonas sp. MF6747]MBK3510771.1 DUF2591 family protein [Pseudomonas sp. MF6747]